MAKVRGRKLRGRKRLQTVINAGGNPLRTDPSRTGAIRKQFIAELRKRFTALEQSITKLIVQDDILGLVPLQNFNPNHDDDGRFSSSDSGSKDNPVRCGSDIEKAATLLSQGKYVHLSQPDQVATLLKKMQKLIVSAQQLGEKAPKFDLCHVSVPKTNLFCQESLGIPRIQMPQLRGLPLPNTHAATKKAGKDGKVDLSRDFVEHLKKPGIIVEKTEVRASHLRASQAEISGARVVQLVKETREGVRNLREKPIFVTKDNYILDGHHHWAADVAHGHERGKEYKIPVYKLDMEIGRALKMANEYTRVAGLAPKSGDTANAFCPTGPGGGKDNTCSPRKERYDLSIGEIVASLGEGLTETGKEAVDKLRDKAKQLKDKMIKRYGVKTTAAIFLSGQAVSWGTFGVGTAVGVPAWVPTPLNLIPGAVLAEIHHQICQEHKEACDPEQIHNINPNHDELGRFSTDASPRHNKEAASFVQRRRLVPGSSNLPKQLPSREAQKLLAKSRPAQPLRLARIELTNYDPSKAVMSQAIPLQAWTKNIEGAREAVSTINEDEGREEYRLSVKTFKPEQIFADFTNLPEEVRTHIPSDDDPAKELDEVLVHYSRELKASGRDPYFTLNTGIKQSKIDRLGRWVAEALTAEWEGLRQEHKLTANGLTLKDLADAAAAEADPTPTPAQVEAGNYKKGHITIQGLPITIETAAGQLRKGKYKLSHHYGYIKRTESEADGDHIDVFLGPHLESEVVFVVDQYKLDRKFDEHKCMIGFLSAKEAKRAYLSNYSKDWQGFGGIRALTMEQFRQWVEDGDTKNPIVGQELIHNIFCPTGEGGGVDAHCSSTDRAKALSDAAEKVHWKKGPFGSTYSFTTSKNIVYRVVAEKTSIKGLPAVDVMFEDDYGDTGLSENGGAYEVLTKVLTAVTSLVKKDSPNIITFTGEEKSRRKLYRKMLGSLTSTLPGYSAVAFPRGLARDRTFGSDVERYALVKREYLPRLQEKMPKTMAEATIIANGNPHHDERGRFSSAPEEIIQRFSKVTQAVFGETTGTPTTRGASIGDREITAWLQPGGERVRLDFGAVGKGPTYAAPDLTAGSLDLVRTLKRAVLGYHDAGFKIEVAAADDRRRKLYRKTLERLGLELVGQEEQGASKEKVQLWNIYQKTTNENPHHDVLGRFSSVDSSVDNPTKSYKLYRGVSSTHKPNDYGVAGKGEYWSGSKEVAAQYAGARGEIVEGEISLSNPLVATYSELNKLQERLYGRFLTGFEPELSEKFDSWMRENGYDGAVLYDQEISKTIPQEVVKLAVSPLQSKTHNENPNHDEKGRFAPANWGDGDHRIVTVRGCKMRVVKNPTKAQLLERLAFAKKTTFSIGTVRKTVAALKGISYGNDSFIATTNDPDFNLHHEDMHAIISSTLPEEKRKAPSSKSYFVVKQISGGTPTIMSYREEDTADPEVHKFAKRVGMVVNAGDWKFRENHEKVLAFQEWLKQQIQSKIVGQAEEALWKKFVEAGFQKGAGRSFNEVKMPPPLPPNPSQASQYARDQSTRDFYRGTKEEFLRSSFGQPESVAKVKLLVGRVLTDLKGVTDAMATTMSRILADGLTQGKNPRQIAKELNQSVEGIGLNRAMVIARTEVIRAHAEGQLDSFEKLGITEVGAQVEWSTAGDTRVCKKCAPLDGTVMAIAQARGMIPLHPQCRCAWIAALHKLGKRKLVPTINFNPNHDSIGRFSSSSSSGSGVSSPPPIIPELPGYFDTSVTPDEIAALDEIHKKEIRNIIKERLDLNKKAKSGTITEDEKRRLEEVLTRFKELSKMGRDRLKGMPPPPLPPVIVLPPPPTVKAVEGLDGIDPAEYSKGVRLRVLARHTEQMSELAKSAEELQALRTIAYQNMGEYADQRAAIERYDEKRKAHSLLEAEHRKRIHQELSLPLEKRAAISSSINPTPVGKKIKKIAKEGEEFLAVIIAVDGERTDYSAQYEILKRGARAFHRAIPVWDLGPRKSGIHISKTSGAGVTVHEWGHALEHQNPDIGRAALKFLQERVGNEPLKPMIGRGYKRGEMGRDDDFEKAFGQHARYVGKDYYGRATEIMSMGLEKLFNDPVGFANQDPDYFDFVVGIAHGPMRKK